MPRQPKPWYRKDRDSWFVTIGGTRHNLGPDKKEAFTKFYAIMQEPELKPVSAHGFAAIADAFLDWVRRPRKRSEQLKHAGQGKRWPNSKG